MAAEYADTNVDMYIRCMHEIRDDTDPQAVKCFFRRRVITIAAEVRCHSHGRGQAMPNKIRNVCIRLTSRIPGYTSTLLLTAQYIEQANMTRVGI